MNLSVLVGQKIRRAYFNEGGIYLVSSGRGRNQKVYALTPIGERADTYVNSVDGADALTGAIILEVEDLVLTKAQRGEYGDVTDSWAHRLRTTKGTCTIDMRCEHNGYYGGNLMLYEVSSLPKEATKLRDDDYHTR